MTSKSRKVTVGLTALNVLVILHFSGSINMAIANLTIPDFTAIAKLLFPIPFKTVD